MDGTAAQGRVVILNGAPRSGKSSIAAAIQARVAGTWINLGVDTYGAMTPTHLRPGIGLRPGGERPDLEAFVATGYAALYESVAAHSRLGLDVVVDVGHHRSYSKPLDPLGDAARRLAGLPAMLVGVFCPIGTIMERRNAGQAGRAGLYLTGSAGEPVPAPVAAWQEAVHQPGIYDLTVDTSVASAEDCADLIAARLAAGLPSPTALERIAAL